MKHFTDTKRDFGQGSVAANILRLAIPMTLAQLINVLYNVVDRAYIGHIPGTSTDALTGIGLTLPVITVIMAFANLFGMGGAPLFSIARGANEPQKAERIMGNSFSMLLISGTALSAACCLFRKPLLYLFGASDITYPYADAYVTLYLLGTLFVMISLGMNNFINAQGFGVTGMLTVSIGAMLNLLLDPLFIFSFHMGVRGAALATVISQAISALWVLRFLLGKKTTLRIQKENLPIRWRLYAPCLALGLSPFVMQSTEGVISICFNSSLQRFGGDMAVGAMTVLATVMQMAMLPLQGLTQGTQPLEIGRAHV